MQRGAVMRTTGMLNAGDYTGALSDINGAIDLGDEVPDALHEAYMLKGEALEGLGRKSDAIAVYQFLLATYPESGAAYQARGRLVELGVPCAH
jgi:tetratricopeptide (TPR) repeat protein